MEYKLKANLQRISMVSISISVWNTKTIKDRIKNFFKYTYKRSEYGTTKEKWDQLTKKILEDFHKIILPLPIQFEISYVIRCIGLKIFNWIEYLIDSGLEFQQTGALHFTMYGMIDKKKIFKNWFEDRSQKPEILFVFASNYCNEDYLKILWNEMPHHIKTKRYLNNLIYKRCYTLEAYWRCRIENCLNFLVKFFNITYGIAYDWHRSLEENMFNVTVSDGHEFGVKYFWKQLKEEDRGRIIKENAIILANNSWRFEDIVYLSTNQYEEKEQYLEILSFLLEKMYYIERTEVLNNCGLKIILKFLSNWPWQDFFVNILTKIWDNLTKQEFSDLILVVTYNLNMSKNYSLRIEGSSFQNILQLLWKNASFYLKNGICYNTFKKIYENLFECEDLKSLKLILTDDYIKNKRIDLFSEEIYNLFLFISERKYTFTEEYLEAILLPQELLRINFKENSMEFERKICRIFITDKRYDLTFKFLNWRFDTVKKRENFKKEFAYSKNSVDVISDIWKNSKGEIAVKSSLDYLVWCLGSDVDKLNKFRKEILLRKKMINDIIEKLEEDHCCFSEWCLNSWLYK